MRSASMWIKRCYELLDFKRVGIFIVFLLLPLLIQAQTQVLVLTIKDDIINPVTATYIEKTIQSAKDSGSIVIIEMDTPGGLLKSTEKIVKAILNSPVPIITYVYPKGARAASAGTFIGYASNILAMSPSTHIGAAHPVIGGGTWGNLDEETKNKVINDTLAWAKNIAQTRNRPFSFIKDAIEKSVSITEQEAISRNICDVVAKDMPELLEKIDGKLITTAAGQLRLSTKDSYIKRIELSGREKFLNTLIDPNIAYILLTLGFLGLIFEVTHPGFGFPGIAGIICLILAFYAFSILPINYAGLVLIILGIIFFIVEAFTPTFGMFTLGGIVSFSFGSIMLFNQPAFIKISYKVILALILTLSALSFFLLSKIIAALRQRPRTGKDALIGEEAVAFTNITKKGKVFLHGEIWNAVGTNIKKGDKVIVEKVKGLKLFVKKTE